MERYNCTCHCGGSMFYKHLHDPSCDLFTHGEEAPQSKEAQLQAALDAERARVKELEADSDTWKQAAYDQADAHKATQSQLQAQLRQVEGERDHAKKMEALQKEVADNQTWHVQKLKDWRDTVTLALQRPGGARFEDVPEHIKGLVMERDALSIWVNALRDSYDDLESRHADMLGDLTTLQQLVAALPVVDVQEVSVWLSPDESGWFVSKRPAFPAGLYWAHFRTQDEADSFRALLAYRATLVAQDAGKAVSSG